ncbi:MAG: hypothetical protein IJK89_12465 [Clostridia bacterium]|nr:hypothetical protein [Clostridia bacterium]
MIAIPEFSENRDDAVLMYFSAEGKDETALRREIEKTYVCFSRIGAVVKNGKKYIVVAIDDE